MDWQEPDRGPAVTGEPLEVRMLSDVMADGRYGVTIQLGEQVRGLSVDDAYRYAAAVLAVAQRAEYDAAVMHQLTRLQVDMKYAAETMNDLRKRRPPVAAATWPIELSPGVNMKLKPFVAVHANGEQLGQWTLEDARSHALIVLELIEAVALDQGYFEFLTDDRAGLGLDEGRARQIVSDVANFRP